MNISHLARRIFCLALIYGNQLHRDSVLGLLETRELPCVWECVCLCWPSPQGAVRRLAQAAAGEPPVVSRVAALCTSVLYPVHNLTSIRVPIHKEWSAAVVCRRFAAVIATVEGVFVQIVLINRDCAIDYQTS